MIKKTSELVLVEVGANAHFECLVDANPVNEQVITWKRRKNDSESSVPSSSSFSSSSYDKSDDSEESSSSSSSVFNRMRTDVEVFNQGEENGGVSSSNFGGGVPLKGTLVVLNASLADSGTSFDCLADNGVGKRSKATMTLLVLRKFALLCFGFLLLCSVICHSALSYANGGLLAAALGPCCPCLSHVFTAQSFVRGNLLFGCCCCQVCICIGGSRFCWTVCDSLLLIKLVPVLHLLTKHCPPPPPQSSTV